MKKQITLIVFFFLISLLYGSRLTPSGLGSGSQSFLLAALSVIFADWNPEDYASPHGYWLCDSYDVSCAVKPLERAKFEIMAAGYQPGRACATDPFCRDSYATLLEVTTRLGRAPTIAEILYMIAGTEYFAFVDYPVQGVENFTIREAGQEALARNYYAACGINSCQGDELYKLLSAYQPWYGDPYVIEGAYSAAARAIELLDKGLYNDFLGTGILLWQDIVQILDLQSASHRDHRWVDGRNGERPWSWFGPFRTSTAHRPITYGMTAEDTALLGASTADGFLLLMFTGDQDLNFNLAYLSP